MRNISFSLTTPQFLDGSKTVTRRLGWKTLKPGTRLMAVRKSQGLKKGEKVERLGVIEVLSVDMEPLNAIRAGDAAREGFPAMPEWRFVNFFREVNDCHNDTEVTRIEFRRVFMSIDETAGIERGPDGLPSSLYLR